MNRVSFYLEHFPELVSQYRHGKFGVVISRSLLGPLGLVISRQIILNISTTPIVSNRAVDTIKDCKQRVSTTCNAPMITISIRIKEPLSLYLRQTIRLWPVAIRVSVRSCSIQQS